MDTRKSIMSQFLTETEHTGRFIVKSVRTGKTYAVEPIGNTKTGWGDVDPATKQVTGQYGKKYRGAVDKKDSLITEANGFTNIQMLEPGYSPMAVISELDSKYPTVEPS